MTLLDEWIRHGVTIGKFWGYLMILQRHDVIHDCRPIIMSDCQTCLNQKKKLLDQEKKFLDQMKNPANYDDDYEEYQFLPVMGPTDRGTRKIPYTYVDDVVPYGDPFSLEDNYDPSMHFTYDAFVCYNEDDPEDKRFVKDMIEELEGRRGLRLYVPGRNDLLGAFQPINNTSEIERNCRRVIIVLSGSFLQSRYFGFQERFAQELSTDERQARWIAVIREKGAVAPSILNGCYTLEYNYMNEINWVLLTPFIQSPITRRTYRELERYRNRRGLSLPWPAGANENTALKEVSLFRNVQPPPDVNGSPESMSPDHTRTRGPDDASENTIPKVVNEDHTTPKVVLPPRPNVRSSSVSRSSSPFTPAIRTDLQLLQKEKHITESVQNGGEITVLEPITHIETYPVHEDETEPKHVLPEEHIDSMSPVHLEYQNQPTTVMQQEQNTRDTILSHSPIPTEPDEQTTRLTHQLLADQTSSMALSEQLISAPSSNDQRTETFNRGGESSSEKNDKS